MKPDTTRASAWVYRGIWAILTRWLRVPATPPDLPAAQGEVVEKFRPDEGYLRYLKFWFWLVFLPMDLPVFIVWGILAATHWGWALALLPVALVIAFLPDVLAYISIHLKYDTTWYVMSDRSLRIRRGVATITEMTITFENVQNVKVEQGPVERHFGIGRVVVETAGVSASAGPKGHSSGGANQAVLIGVADLEAMKACVLQHVRKCRSAGLGDERLRHHEPSAHETDAMWTPEHVEALREIRSELLALRSEIGSSEPGAEATGANAFNARRPATDT